MVFRAFLDRDGVVRLGRRYLVREGAVVDVVVVDGEVPVRRGIELGEDRTGGAVAGRAGALRAGRTARGVEGRAGRKGVRRGVHRDAAARTPAAAVGRVGRA